MKKNMRTIICLSIFAIFGCCFAINKTTKEITKDVAVKSLIDKIIDIALRRVKEETVEPIKLSDEIKQFKKKILLIPMDGEIILHNGKLWGIHSMNRSGDAKFSVNHTLMDVNTTIQFDIINFMYNFQANIYKLSTNGIINGNITKLVVDVGLTLDIKNKNIELSSLALTKAKTLRIQIDSAKFMDRVINFILKSITTIFKTTILSAVEKELQEYLGHAIHFNKNIS